jgi:hypothetical protein
MSLGSADSRGASLRNLRDARYSVSASAFCSTYNQITVTQTLKFAGLTTQTVAVTPDPVTVSTTNFQQLPNTFVKRAGGPYPTWLPATYLPQSVSSACSCFVTPSPPVSVTATVTTGTNTVLTTVRPPSLAVMLSQTNRSTRRPHQPQQPPSPSTAGPATAPSQAATKVLPSRPRSTHLPTATPASLSAGRPPAVSLSSSARMAVAAGRLTTATCLATRSRAAMLRGLRQMDIARLISSLMSIAGTKRCCRTERCF